MKWKRELQGVKVPQRGTNCENCLEDKTCQACISDPKMNCFECEITKSRNDCFKKITPFKTYPTEINKLKRRSPNENGYMLPHQEEEAVENVFIEERNEDFF